MGSNARSTKPNVNASSIVSPPGSKTPPSMPAKKTLLFPEPSAERQKSRTGSEPVDADALSVALKEYEEAGRRRERTPGTSPSRKRQRVYGDRYVVWLLCSESEGYNLVLATALTSVASGSYQTVMVKTCRQLTICSMKMAVRPLHPGRKSAAHSPSCTSRRVCRLSVTCFA